VELRFRLPVPEPFTVAASQGEILQGTTSLDLRADLCLSLRTLRDAALTATVLKGSLRLGQARVQGLKGDQAFVSVATAKLPAGAYQVELKLEAEGKAIGRAMVPFTVVRSPWEG
jgi:hypothetical protein